MPISLTEVAKSVEKFIVSNSPTILTAIGVTGAVATAYLTGKASFKAATIIRDEEDARREILLNKEKVNLVWREYIPAGLTGVGTIVAIIGANHVNNRRAAAIAAAYSLSERAFTEYKDKVTETLGKKKEQTVVDDIAQDRVRRNPPPNNLVAQNGTDVLCCDGFSGRYFYSTVERIKRAEIEIDREIMEYDYASLSDFYSKSGLDPTDISDDVGWNHGKKMDIQYSTVLTKDDKPAMVFSFNVQPIGGYNRLT